MSTIQFQTDESTEIQSVEVFKQLGITMSDAINMFLRQSILYGGLPFDVKTPYNETTQAALIDMEKSKGKGLHGKDFKTALAELKRKMGRL